MGEDSDSKALVYIAVGALAAVGVGYLVWRYGMTDESRQRTLSALRQARISAMQNVKSMASGAKDAVGDATEHALDGASHARASAMKKAGEMGQRLRP
jgi:hypothetical protein